MERLADIMLDLNGDVVSVPRAVVAELAALAAADAGRDSARRDLSLILARAEAPGRATLRRREVEVLRRLVAEHGLTDRLSQLHAD